MQFSNEFVVNPRYIVGWEEIPEVFLDEITKMSQEFTGNPEVFADRELMERGLVLPLSEEIDEVVSWGELDGFGILFAINYQLKDRGIKILGTKGVSLSRDPVEYSPQEVDQGIKDLRRWDYQIEGLTK